jgi:hypothetical protein
VVKGDADRSVVVHKVCLQKGLVVELAWWLKSRCRHRQGSSCWG